MKDVYEYYSKLVSLEFMLLCNATFEKRTIGTIFSNIIRAKLI
jgi:hypothetical protein